MGTRAPLAWLGVALLAVVGVVRADTVHLANGRVVEGQAERTADGWVVRQANGIELRLDASEVLRVDEGQTPREAFAARRAALADDDLSEHRVLAAWADDQGLAREALALREAIVARWPDDRATRRALDHVRHDDQWLTRDDYMRSLGLVATDDGSSWITPDEAARRERGAKAKRLEPKVRKALRGARRDPARAAEQLAAFDDEAAVPVLVDSLRDDALPLRTLAAQELGRRKAQAAAQRLAQVAVEDTRQDARQAALDSLQAIAHPDVPRFLIRQLDRPNLFHRVHAAQALSALPVAAAVPALIVQLRQATSGFGRNHISILTQRAYIRDFELAAGGTGLTLGEVADPQVDVQSEGVSLEVKVVLWERYTVATVLQRLTGQSFGADPDAWERWWRGARDGFQLPD